MARPFFTAFHRPVTLGDTEPTPLTDWTRSWEEARNELLRRGLAGYVHGIFFMMPNADIQMEVQYG